ncbi:hypothetical protein [Rhodoferax sediminis]|nr:hypothetical protein [Rhodoferax sediminis]
MVAILLLLDKTVPYRDTGDIATVIAGVPGMTEYSTEFPSRLDGFDHARD